MLKRAENAALFRPAVLTLLATSSIDVVGCGGGSSTQQVHGRVLGGSQSAATVVSATGGGTGSCGGAVAGTQMIVKPIGDTARDDNVAQER
jgi:hypothetical protein